ncbi:787_t:CDS:2, partial [Funneliformis mosseae]
LLLNKVPSSDLSFCFKNVPIEVSIRGFNVTIDVNYQLYDTIDSYSNKSKGVNFSHLVVAATLAEESARQAFNAAIAHANIKEKKVLIIRFDCSWSHSCNAKQASREFIYLDDLEGKDRNSNEKVVIQKGNFDASSHQMEHAILIALLEQIILVLKALDLWLKVCIDGDLDSNKTLANIPVVSEIYADLKP